MIGIEPKALPNLALLNALHLTKDTELQVKMMQHSFNGRH